MSMDPNMMAQLLASRLGSGGQTGYVGSGQAGSPQVAVPNGAGDIAQKLMLMAALRKNPQALQNPNQPPQPNQMGGINAIPQQMNQQPLPGGINA